MMRSVASHSKNVFAVMFARIMWFVVFLTVTLYVKFIPDGLFGAVKVMFTMAVLVSFVGFDIVNPPGGKGSMVSFSVALAVNCLNLL